MVMSAPFDPRRVPPRTLFLGLPASHVCNYRCRHCHIWRNERLPDALPRERRLELVREFAALSPGGMVVLSGGEVTLDWEDLLEVLREGREAGLRSIVVTNGSGVSTPERAVELIVAGVAHVSVSLDSHRPELHNYVRGRAEAFAEATDAIRRLAAARVAAASPVTVGVSTVLFRENLPELPLLEAFALEIGAQFVDFQLLARTFSNAHPSRDAFFEKHFWHRPEEKAEAKRLLSTFLTPGGERLGSLVKGPADLGWILRYVDDPDFRTERPVCGSHRMNLVVDARGDVALCFNSRSILDAPFVGNVRSRSLAELWAGEKAAADRGVMDSCRLNCGALNCHRAAESPAPALAVT